MKEIITIVFAILFFIPFYSFEPQAMAQSNQVPKIKNTTVIQSKKETQITKVQVNQKDVKFRKEIGEFFTKNKPSIFFEIASSLDYLSGYECDINSPKRCIPRIPSLCFRATNAEECVTRINHCKNYQPSPDSLHFIKSLKELSLTNLDAAIEKMKIAITNHENIHICKDAEEQKKSVIKYCEVFYDNDCKNPTEETVSVTKDLTYFCYASESDCIEDY